MPVCTGTLQENGLKSIRIKKDHILLKMLEEIIEILDKSNIKYLSLILNIKYKFNISLYVK